MYVLDLKVYLENTESIGFCIDYFNLYTIDVWTENESYDVSLNSFYIRFYPFSSVVAMTSSIDTPPEKEIVIAFYG